MEKQLVFNAKEVEGFLPPGSEGAYVSRLLVDPESVGSQKLVMNHFTLKTGKRTYAGSHPAPYDEIYYILRGRGVVYLGDDREAQEAGPDTVVFIPYGTLHYLENTGDEDLEMITVMPGPLVKGANTLYDQRKAAWGTSFKKTGNTDAHR